MSKAEVQVDLKPVHTDEQQDSALLYHGKHRRFLDLDNEDVTYPISVVKKGMMSLDLDFLMNIDGEWMYVCSHDYMYQFDKLKKFATEWGTAYKIINIRTGRLIDQS